MNIDRKTFLRGVGVGALSLAARSALASDRGAPDLSLPELDAADPESFWAAVRRWYPLEADPLYLNTGGLGPASEPVLSMVEQTTRRLQAHSTTGHELIEPAREVMARFLGVTADEICFTRNATEGNSIVAAGLQLAEGDEVIFESHAHPGGSFPWLNQAKQRGVKVRVFEPDRASAAGNLARIHDLITARTKVVQVSHLTCTTGLLMPIREIADLAHRQGAWFHVDGAQALGMIPLDLKASGCDSYAASGHKWLGGPHETGVLYLRREQLERVAPTGIGAYSGELLQLPGELTYRAAAARHEYGTRNAALVSGLAQAVHVQTAIGPARIAARGRELATFLVNAFRDLDGIELLTPLDESLRGSMVTIRHQKADAKTLFGYLLQHHGLRCRPVTEQGLEAVRISLHVFTSAADSRRVAAAVQAAADHFA